MDQRYTHTAMWLHWLIAILLMSQFAFGWYLNDIARGVPARGYFVNLHKSTGMLIALLILSRIVWRLTHAPPSLPDTIPRSYLDWKILPPCREWPFATPRRSPDRMLCVCP